MRHGDIAVNRVAAAHKIRDLRGKAAFVADKLRTRVGVYVAAAEHDGDYIKAAAVRTFGLNLMPKYRAAAGIQKLHKPD